MKDKTFWISENILIGYCYGTSSLYRKELMSNNIYWSQYTNYNDSTISI
jgi:hypothetical protein